MTCLAEVKMVSVMFQNCHLYKCRKYQLDWYSKPIRRYWFITQIQDATPRWISPKAVLCIMNDVVRWHAEFGSISDRAWNSGFCLYLSSRFSDLLEVIVALLWATYEGFVRSYLVTKFRVDPIFADIFQFSPIWLENPYSRPPPCIASHGKNCSNQIKSNLFFSSRKQQHTI